MTVSSDGPPGASLSSREVAGERWTLALASLASFIVALDFLVVTTALDTMRRDLDASVTSLQWTLTAYSVTFAVLLLTGAALGDRFGRRRVLIAGLALFLVGSATAAMSSNIELLIAARVIQGAGAAATLPLSLAMVSATFPAERRGAAIGTLEGISGLAVIAGPILGGLISQYLSWEWIFWINVPICVVSIVLILLRLDESYGPDQALDGVGLLLATVSAFGLVWGVARGNELGWTSAQVAASITVGLMFAALFVSWESRRREPMLPMRFFRSRAFSFGIATALLISASLYATIFFAAQFLHVAHGHDPLAAGMRLVPFTATLLVIAPIAGRFADRVGERPVLAAGLVLQAIGLGWLALIAATDQSYVAVLPAFVVAGVGFSMAVPVSQTAVVTAVTDDEVGKASGATNVFQEFGGALGVAVAVAVFGSFGSQASGAEFVDGFRPAMAAAAAFSVIGAVAAASLPRRRTPALR